MLGKKSFTILFCNYYLKYRVLFFTLLFVNTHLFSQTKKIDSLNLLLQTAKHDTIRINTLCKMAALISQNNPDTSFTLLSKAQKLAEDNIGLISLKNSYKTAIDIRKVINSKEEKGVTLQTPTGVKLVFTKQLAFINKQIGEINYFIKDNYNEGLSYYTKSFQIYMALNNKAEMANCLCSMGDANYTLGKLKEAEEYCNQSIKIAESINSEKEMIKPYKRLGVIYKNKGLVKEALTYYNKSLKLSEKFNDKEGVATILNSIGNIYSDEGQKEEALTFYKSSLKIYEEIKNRPRAAVVINNIGIMFQEMGKLNEALRYCNRSLEIAQEINSKEGIAGAINLRADIYLKQNRLPEALINFERCLNTFEALNNKRGITFSYINISKIYLLQNNLNQALKYGVKGLSSAQELGFPFHIKDAAFNLKQIYQKLNNPTKALQVFEIYIAMNDSLNKQENHKAAYKNQLQNQYDKKALADSIKLADEKKIASSKLSATQAKLKQEKTQRFALYGIAFVLLVLAGLLYYNYQVKNKSNQQLTLQKLQIEQKNQQLETQKNSISSQNKLLENKNNQITDSIEYARKIQETMLPNPATLTRYFDDAFIYFQPKDIVSGDFYWFKEIAQSSIVFAVADCTGHGVPGALMSVLGHNSLDSAYGQPTDTEPTNIVQYLDTFFKQKTSTQNTITTNVDGMALSLINYNKQAQLITYTTANHYIYFIRDNQLTEIKSNNFSIGSLQNQTILQGSLNVQKNDMFYLCTDGYADQKGGPQNRKFMTKKLKETFIKIANLPASEQHHILKTEMDTWKGTNSQIDDMLVVGVKI